MGRQDKDVTELLHLHDKSKVIKSLVESFITKL